MWKEPVRGGTGVRVLGSRARAQQSFPKRGGTIRRSATDRNDPERDRHGDVTFRAATRWSEPAGGHPGRRAATLAEGQSVRGPHRASPATRTDVREASVHSPGNGKRAATAPGRLIQVGKSWACPRCGGRTPRASSRTGSQAASYSSVLARAGDASPPAVRAPVYDTPDRITPVEGDTLDRL